MSRLPALEAREVMRALERAGFALVRVNGSHHFFRHREDPSRSTVVPLSRKSLPPGTLAEILKQARLSREEFLHFL